MSNDITKLADIQLTAPQLEKLQYRLARADIDNSMVSDLGIACEMATAYLELKEKYDRYEKALKAIVGYYNSGPAIIKHYRRAVELLRDSGDQIHGEFCGSKHWPLCEQITEFLKEAEGEGESK